MHCVRMQMDGSDRQRAAFARSEGDPFATSTPAPGHRRAALEQIELRRRLTPVGRMLPLDLKRVGMAAGGSRIVGSGGQSQRFTQSGSNFEESVRNRVRLACFLPSK